MKKPGSYSIKQQMIAIFVGLNIFVLAALFVINLYFLEPYYVSNKKVEFVKVYDKIEKAAQKGDLEDEDLRTDISQIAEKNNMYFVVIDERTQSAVTNVHSVDLLTRQLLGYLTDKRPKDSKVLKAGKKYEINQCKEMGSESEYIEMWGQLDDRYIFLVRSPLESIEDSARISNRFLILIGCGMILLCGILIWFFSKKISDPLRELATLSNRMADQDFDAKYTGGGACEIRELGDNFNTMSEKLEATISELKSANNSLQKDIEKKDKLEKMRNEFLGNVSHELKTPIALIQGYAEGLKDGISEDPESREFYCSVILDEASKMNQMVKNLLTLNQIEFGSEEVVFQRFDLTEVIQGVIQSLDIMLRQEEVKVIFRQEESVYVWADAFKVEQVVRNYLTNAIHHADGDKVIDVKILTENEKAKVTVFNTGMPIPEEDLTHIWDKFYKVDKAHTREYGGNGIGLSIVKAIMESFHREYGVKNYDNGVEFWFELDRK